MSKLHIVGTTLSDKAKSSDGDVADAFGRSAFNRYYYSAYLEVRDLLVRFDSNWDVSHADAPNLVEKSLPEVVRRELKRQEKISAISRAQSQRISSGVASAGSAIAEVLRIAYKVRVISDYRPEELVTFESATFHLDSHTEGEARAWLSFVEAQKGRILRFGKELGLV
ncbi:hypothetical protein LPB72_07315 [Hydrogenophaga crassostreae]|uniref:Uncharacterized protein n=1 Tax=Hydrogenophaga crassostreae TaxID=1763535 RepID=A0A163CJ90_9BURK|nr:hypothetical protein [Hydrogenophaga crassostreae]AOW13145.1 hypothetical protein LPB072_10055 [Hydrogenophaga crassostreae]OAD42710.1 hypothetical protein LPB72_07315 [Hydrogenophaga crassostreae]